MAQFDLLIFYLRFGQLPSKVRQRFRFPLYVSAVLVWFLHLTGHRFSVSSAGPSPGMLEGSGLGPPLCSLHLFPGDRSSAGLQLGPTCREGVWGLRELGHL